MEITFMLISQHVKDVFCGKTVLLLWLFIWVYDVIFIDDKNVWMLWFLLWVRMKNVFFVHGKERANDVIFLDGSVCKISHFKLCFFLIGQNVNSRGHHLDRVISGCVDWLQRCWYIRERAYAQPTISLAWLVLGCYAALICFIFLHFLKFWINILITKPKN